MTDLQATKVLLSSYRHALRQAEAALDELYQIKRCRERLTAYISDLPRVNKERTSPVESALVRLDRIERTIAEGVERLETSAQVVRDLIAAVEDEPSRDLLTLRYLEGLRWEEIAVRLCYTYRHVTRLHGQALKLAADIAAKKRCP